MITAETILKDKNPELIAVSNHATVIEAIQKMVSKRVGAILVRQDDSIVGIWTERDLLRNTLEPGFDPKSDRIDQYMSHPVRSVAHDAPIEEIQDMFLGLFIRHILVEKNGVDIGLLSIGDVTRAGLLTKDQEIRKIKSIASWQYYENWGWHHQYKDQTKQTRIKK